MKRNIIRADTISSCYFRTSASPPYRKALLQITERCNLHCAHCFVSAGMEGIEMNTRDIENIIPVFKDCNIVSITLTGGEPFVHPDIIQIVKLICEMDIKVSICTNATLISNTQIWDLVTIGRVHVNVSLDGFRPESHGKFRGDAGSFETTKKTIKLLGDHQLLHGLLVTPNNLACVEEYKQICQFAIENKASYVLMNPLSNMGRGVFSKKALESSEKTMKRIRIATSQYQDLIQIVYARFPNESNSPLGSCEAGNIIYIFTKGDVAICPYLVFAARTPKSQYSPNDFIVGNIFNNQNLALHLAEYKLSSKFPLIGQAMICKTCLQKDKCGRGCPAAIVASGDRIDSLDSALCPENSDYNDEI